jgi:dTDP-4-dehydrorhamnose 3,5-epimerase-like enzyme
LTSPLARVRLVELAGNPEGPRQISLVELERDLPFPARRIYWIHSLAQGEVRGSHAHRTTQQLLVAVGGVFSVRLDDGEATAEYVLSNPTVALWLPSGLWREIVVLEDKSVLLSIASTAFDEADYIRDYREFLLFAAGKRAAPPEHAA